MKRRKTPRTVPLPLLLSRVESPPVRGRAPSRGPGLRVLSREDHPNRARLGLQDRGQSKAKDPLGRVRNQAKGPLGRVQNQAKDLLGSRHQSQVKALLLNREAHPRIKDRHRDPVVNPDPSSKDPRLEGRVSLSSLEPQDRAPSLEGQPQQLPLVAGSQPAGCVLCVNKPS